MPVVNTTGLIIDGQNIFEIEFQVLTLSLISSDTGKYPFAFQKGPSVLIPCHSAACG